MSERKPKDISISPNLIFDKDFGDMQSESGVNGHLHVLLWSYGLGFSITPTFSIDYQHHPKFGRKDTYAGLGMNLDLFFISINFSIDYATSEDYGIETTFAPPKNVSQSYKGKGKKGGE